MRNLSSRSLDRELDEADELPEPSRVQGDVIAFRRSAPGSGWGGCMMTMVSMKPPTCMDHGQQGAMRAGSDGLLSGLCLQHWPILSSLLMHSAARLPGWPMGASRSVLLDSRARSGHSAA